MNNFLESTNKSIKSFNDFFKINPHKHWNFLIKIFFILVLALIIFSVYLLYEIKNEQIFQVTLNQQENKTLLKENILKTVLGDFSNKEAKRLEIKDNPSLYSDPSL